MPVLALRLRLVRHVAERDAACVDMQRARPVFEQIAGEIPVQGLACEADGFVRGFQLTVPAGPSLRLFGGGREHIPFGFRLPAVRRAASPAFHVRISDARGTMPDHLGPFRAQLPVHEQARRRSQDGSHKAKTRIGLYGHTPDSGGMSDGSCFQQPASATAFNTSDSGTTSWLACSLHAGP